jgi:hypothetical protein
MSTGLQVDYFLAAEFNARCFTTVYTYLMKWYALCVPQINITLLLISMSVHEVCFYLSGYPAFRYKFWICWHVSDGWDFGQSCHGELWSANIGLGYSLNQGWRTCGTRSQSGTRDFLGKRHSLLSQFFFPTTLLFKNKYEGLETIGLCGYHYYQITLRVNYFSVQARRGE